MAPSRHARPIEGTSVSGLIRGELSAAGGKLLVRERPDWLLELR
jgi:hypothetical protein